MKNVDEMMMSFSVQRANFNEAIDCYCCSCRRMSDMYCIYTICIQKHNDSMHKNNYIHVACSGHQIFQAMRQKIRVSAT